MAGSFHWTAERQAKNRVKKEAFFAANGMTEAEMRRRDDEIKNRPQEAKKADQALTSEQQQKKKRMRGMSDGAMLTGNQGIIGSMLNLGGTKLLGG
jgi:VIT1/CCC1 family predicted Fe2+/Mn2+ transporter